MDELLKKLVLNKINEIYPETSKEDIIVLFGSRAKGFFIKDSDIDIVIFTNKEDYFKKISIQKGLRKKEEDAGFEIFLDNGLLLETKIEQLRIPKFNVTFYHDVISAKPLTGINRFKNFQKEIKREFMKNHEDLLFYYYVHFFNELKNLEGLSKRTDKFSKINFSMKKGMVIQALLRLVLIMSKKPFTFDKCLAQEAAQTKYWKKISIFIKRIDEMNSFEDYKKLKTSIRTYVDLNMPKRPYVSNWWKFLKKFKEYQGII